MRPFTHFNSRFAIITSLFLSSSLPSVTAQSSTPATSFYTTGSGSNQIGIAINVPQGADNTDLYFHVEAPAASTSWFGIGIGDSMSDSLMFVIYESGNNSGSPTVSPRTTTGYTMPSLDSNVNVTVLGSSKSVGSQFYADFHCLNCRTINGKNLDVTSTSQSMFYAIGPSGDLSSDDLNAKISQHSPTMHFSFNLDLATATGTNGVPGLVAVSNSANSSASSTSSSASSTSGNTNPTNTAGANGSTSSSSGGGPTIFNGMPSLAAHTFLMFVAFALIYPLGYLTLRIFEHVLAHAIIQVLATLVVLLGVIAGFRVSLKYNINPKINHPHQIIGIITFLVILAAWSLGLIGHMMYKKYQKPSPLMKGHRVAGPLSIALGVVNACIGFAWAGMSRAIVGYLIFTVLVWLVISGLVFLKLRRNRRKQAMNSQAARNFQEGMHGQPMMTGQQYESAPSYQNVPLQSMESGITYNNQRPK